MRFQTIPILRIFDEARAREFYLDFLGMDTDWEHRLEDEAPLYMQVSRGDLVFHLSEHSGDGSPGTRIFVNTNGVDQLARELAERRYRYNRPSIETAPWGSRVLEVVDPFSNRIVFNERWAEASPGETPDA